MSKRRNARVMCVCGQVMVRDEVTRFTPDVWKPITLEHINVTGEGPLTFHSKKALQKYCKENKVSSGALL